MNNNMPTQQYYSQPYMQTIPEEYKPISAWGYIGYQILFSIPLIGFIFLLVFALGGTRNINLKNFARSYFCLILLGIIIVVVCSLIGVSLFGFMPTSS